MSRAAPATPLLLLGFLLAPFGVASDGGVSVQPGPTGKPAILYPAPADARPGPADVEVGDNYVTLRNQVLEATWKLDRTDSDPGGEPRLRPGVFVDKATGARFDLPRDAFAVRLDPDGLVRSSSLQASAVFGVAALSASSAASRLAEAYSGLRVSVELRSEDGDFLANWSAELRDESNYIRQTVSIATRRDNATMHELILLDTTMKDSRTIGSPDLPGGLAVLGDTFFAGYEHPDACNGDGALPQEGDGVILARLARPGEIRGRYAIDMDVTSLVMSGHDLGVYLDNRHSDVIVEISGAELFSASGHGDGPELLKKHAAVTDQRGKASRRVTRGNVLLLQASDAEKSLAAGAAQGLKYTLRFHIVGRGKYEGEWVFGLRREGLKGHVYCALRQVRLLRSHEPVSGSLVMGVAPQGQLRRGFLAYLERERAHPSRAVLHYNTWYDVGTGDTYSAEDAKAAMSQVSAALSARGVALGAILLDDGWDDPDSGLWEPTQKFANGFQDLVQEAHELQVGLGVWFSPWGGYNEPRQRRLRSARAVGLPVREETQAKVQAVNKGHGACTEAKQCEVGVGGCEKDADCVGNLFCFLTKVGASPPGVDTSTIKDPTLGVCADPEVPSAFLALSLPEYYDYFFNVVKGWLANGARLLKLDGVGNPAGRGYTAAEDWEQTVRLIQDIRGVVRDVFINLSTGTWASPFWLLAADTIWRRGHDHYFEGVGVPRERWITYRDSIVFSEVVSKSPFFPLNSLMTHGVIYARAAWDLTEPEGALPGDSPIPFRHEVRAAFGSGTMLQELYITPSKLSSVNWDDLAAAALWGGTAVDVLADTRWFGGDPRKLEIYGWAAWRDAEDEDLEEADGAAGGGHRAILTLRNPSDQLKSVRLQASDVFELPPHAAGATIVLRSPFADQRPGRLELRPGVEVPVSLAPFDVLVFDSAIPSFPWPPTEVLEVDTHISERLVADSQLLQNLVSGVPDVTVVFHRHEHEVGAGAVTIDAGGLRENLAVAYRNIVAKLEEWGWQPPAPEEDLCRGTHPNNEVNCGAHKARCCAACPQGHGSAWCNGDCEWLGGMCRLKTDSEMGPRAEL